MFVNKLIDRMDQNQEIFEKIVEVYPRAIACRFLDCRFLMTSAIL